MVSLDDIPDFPGLPGQRPPVGETPTVSPVSVVIVYAPLDSSGSATPINAAAVDAYISAEIAANRAYSAQVERWSPWSDLQLQLGFKTASAYNYGRFTLADGSKWYAYLEAEYLNLTDTRYRVSPDDWTTYAPTLGYCTVRRGHVAVAASQNDTYGDQYLLEPEPIDAPPTWGAVAGDAFDDALSTWTAVVVSANDLRGLGATPYFEEHWNADYIGAAAYQATEATAGITGGPQFEIEAPEYPWSNAEAEIYIPKVVPATPSTVDGVAAGGGVFTFSMAGLVNYLAIMQNAPWVIDGISSIRLVPSWAVANPGGTPSAVGEPPKSPTDTKWTTAAAIPVYQSALTTAKPTQTAISNWRTAALSAAGAGNWRKLLTSQFCEVVVAGRDQAVLAPELIQSSNVQVQGIAGSVSGGADVVLPVSYALQGELTPVGIDASGLAGVMSSGYGQALRDPATLDLAFAQLGWGNAYNRVVMIQQYALALAVAADSAAINLGSQGVQTLLGSVAGGPAGLALGAGSVATSAITSALNMGVLDMKLEESVEIAAYQLGVSGVMGQKSVDAAVQSANSRSGTGGFESVGGWRPAAGAGVSVVVKMPAPDRVRAAVSMFERYGYTVGRAMVPPRIDPMQAYSYWEVEDATILGAMPDDARRRLVERFQRGTTVWQNVAEIGTRPSNPPRAGVVY